MIINEGLDIDFSLIIPTRGRLSKLEGCLLSFFNKAKRKHNNEAILVVDHDDSSIRNFSDFIIHHELNVKILTVWRSEMMIRDYNNYGAQCSLGKYLWILNDDYEMTTDHWDDILKNKIEEFCHENHDRVCYVMVDDSTHSESNWNCLSSKGCCCPIQTRESVEALNGVMPWQINSWGADIALYHIYRHLPRPRILDCVRDVKVLHYCRHNNTAEIDDISRRIEAISQKRGGIDAHEMATYINKLLPILNPQ
jgi:hypothetical protein